MIKIGNTVIKNQNNFWNQCLFHPTDAIEDPWGRRILDKIADDGAIKTVRIYTMFEDIVYIGEDGELKYDFRLNDLRLDYMVEKNFDLLLAYGGMPDCIASSTDNKRTAAKNKTRYKGKMWNTAPPKDYALWEEVCYEYTKHIVERYGIETVSKWNCQCFNEPDLQGFFLSQYPKDIEFTVKYRLPEYCKLYKAFERAVRRVSDKISIGGPALASKVEFLGGFLDYVKENNLKLDFVSVHNYGTKPTLLNEGNPIRVENNVERHQRYVDTVTEHGFGHLPILVDEWGLATCGFYNREECPELMVREHEVFSAYFAKLIHRFVYSDFKMGMMCICLSGQHEMVEDFSGFRNFFTLNFITKPIYNMYILAAKLKEKVLTSECGENTYVLPTKDENGRFAVMVSYSSDNFKDELPEIEERVEFAEDISEKTVTVWCIDKDTTNPYRMWEREGSPEMTKDMIKTLREEGRLKPVRVQKGSEQIVLKLSLNAVYMITVE